MTIDARMPFMRPEEGEDDDAFAERFADAAIETMNRWLVKNGHPRIEDDRRKAAQGDKPGNEPSRS